MRGKKRTIFLPGYCFSEVIGEDAATLLCRARRESDHKSVLLRIPQKEFSAAQAIAQLKREYDITRDLNLDGVIRSCSLEQHDLRLILVLDDFAGTPLADVIAKGPIDVVTFLQIAIQLADILGKLHQHHVVHKDIKPGKILFNPTSQQVKVTGFNIASRLNQENKGADNPTVMEGTLAYMSPEQTGRMNREIDYATDFYSLGVTFYEVLTGQLPFRTTDPMELVHAHLAKQPTPPNEVNALLPAPLSAIVMKLLAKNGEGRYQSAYGLKADLELCLNKWRQNGTIPEFTLGQRDVSASFLIPQKLYGRAQEIKTLFISFERASQGTPELVLVSGYSGIGKSALVKEAYDSIVHKKGYFVSGKFDQFQRNIPYRAVIQAFQALVRQLLTEGETQIDGWKAKLLRALGPNGRIIIDVIPEVELIIGPQPPVAELPPTERQNRFNWVFTRFTHVFAQREHPLVIFLDDLQWADTATLSFLLTLMTNPGMRNLLMIGAYRDNEVTDAHPLLLTLAEIVDAGTRVTHITLNPLDLFHINMFISDSLHCDPEWSGPLAELVLNKTNGNPFFVIQFLKSLHQQQLLSYNYSSNEWMYDLQRIHCAQMTDNVVTLMAGKIQRLAEQTQCVTRLAACIGNSFDLGTLSIVNEQSLCQTETALWPAIQEGLILASDANYLYGQNGEHKPLGHAESIYSFLHDRVQQAAYSLIPDEQKQAVHLRVGQLMLQHSDAAEREEYLFDIVNHLNIGAPLIEDAAEQIKLARLNLQAGQKAKSSTAYNPGLTYFKSGLKLLGKRAWKTCYSLAFALYRDLAECEYLCGNFDQAESALTLLLSEARSKLDKAEIYNLRIIQYENMSKYAEAIQCGRDGLRLLGFELPIVEVVKKSAFEQEMHRIQVIRASKRIEDLIDLPVMTQQTMKITMKLLMTLWAPAYIAGDIYLPRLISALMVRLSMTYGNSEESAYAYVTHAITVGSSLGDYESGHEFGKLALKVNDKFNDLKLRAKIHHMFSCFVNLWCKPLQSCFPYSREAYRSGLDSGDFAYATYGIFQESWYALLCGQQDLGHFQQAYRPNLSFLTQVKNWSFADAQRVILHWGLNWQGLTHGKLSLSDETFDEQTYVETYQGNPFFETFYFVAKLSILYTFENYAAARDVAVKASSVVHSLHGTIWNVILCVYHALTLTALYPSSPREQQQIDEDTLTDLIARMNTWADACPENFQHYARLLQAEMAKVKGRHSEAIDLYEEVIRSIQGTGLNQFEALANELYAKFWLSRGNAKIARLYLAEACFGYDQWGAAAKIRDLQERYPDLQLQALAPLSSPESCIPPTETMPSALDLMAVMKAAQVISGEIRLDTLLEKLMRIILENTGAQKGILVQQMDHQLVTAATGSIDDEIVVLQTPVEPNKQISLAVINYVKRTGEALVLADAENDSRFVSDPYIQQNRSKSILCLPILTQGVISEILYLENNLTTDAFTSDRFEMVRILLVQAAISMENARLYHKMEREIVERKRFETTLRKNERQLRRLNEQLEDYSRNLEQKVAGRTREIEQRRQIAESLRDILTIINSNHSLAEILDHIVTEASRLLGSNASAIYHLQTQDGTFCLQTARGLSGEGLSAGVFSTNLRQAILQGQPVAISDVGSSLPHGVAMNSQQPSTAHDPGCQLRALLAVPLVVANEVYGCLVLSYPTPRVFSAEDIGLAITFSAQAALAIENTGLRRRIKQAAITEERGRLARELHDSVTQSLYRLTLLAEGWRRMAQSGKLVDIESPLGELGHLAQQALKEMRLLVHELRPPALEKEGLLGALQQRLSAVERRAGVEARLLVDEVIELPIPVEEGLYRIALEALNNALKHAAAGAVTIHIHADSAYVEMEIKDDGRGFDPSVPDDRGGLGLVSMQERAEKLGGQLAIYSCPGTGTSVKIMLPRTTTS